MKKDEKVKREFRSCEVCESKNTSKMKSVESKPSVDYVSSIVLECEMCGTRWVEEMTEGYHHPIINWRKVN
jgi:C4-type Zn-finger protein